MKNILAKLHTIMSKVDFIPKDKKNTFHNYNYASEQAIKEKMHGLLVDNKVIFTLFSQNLRRAGTITDIDFTYRFYDVDSGEFIEGTFNGTGEDKLDKGTYKAITGAIKYILTSTFLIPTGDDPEKDTQQTEKPTTAKVKPASTTSKLVPCNICGADYKLVPGGISKKTGNHYDAFYSCSTRGCKAKTFKEDEANMMLKPEHRVANVMDGQVDDVAPPPTLNNLPY